MACRDIITIGASAGGIDTLGRVLSRLPGDLPASVFVVQHLSGDSPNMLHKILDRAGPLSVVQARDGESLQPGRV